MKMVDHQNSVFLTESAGNPNLKFAELMTSAQEHDFMVWLEEAARIKSQKANRRRQVHAQREKATKARPERLAAQTKLIVANGGHLPDRWRFEISTKILDGKPVEFRKRVANRPAYIPVYPYDPVVDGVGLGNYWARAAERQDRITNGFKLREDVVLSGCLVRAGLEYSGFKSEKLGTNSALRWPALVHKSGGMRVCWHNGRHSDYDLKLAQARMDGVPDWMLEGFDDGAFEEDLETSSEEFGVQELNMRALSPAYFKVLGLDAPTVEGNKKLLGFLRIDSDLVWQKSDLLLNALKEKVRTKKLRSLPNFIVGIKTKDGKLVRPHLIWLLPINNGVLNVDNKFLRKFKGVYFGLCKALADLGADPQAPATSQLVKNPLSPLYYTECPSDQWYSLQEHATCLDTGLNRMTLVRESLAAITGEKFQHSNEFFNACRDEARRLMARWHHDRDPVYEEAYDAKDYSLLIDRVQEALSALVVAKGMKPCSIEYARQKMATWVVETWNPRRISRKQLPGQGRLQHIVSEIHGTKARQAVGGRYSSATRAAETLKKLVEAWEQLIKEGVTAPSKSALAKASGLSRQTIYNRYQDLQLTITDHPVKDGVMLYRVQDHARPKEEKTYIRSQVESPTSPSESNHIDLGTACGIANDIDESDEHALAEHEAWIAFQEERPLRPAVMDTVLEILHKSSTSAMRNWQHCDQFDVFDRKDHIVCHSNTPVLSVDAIQVA